ncbi:hypothetical protein GCM10027077_11680 [Arenimonas maotaiensis]
MMPGAKVRTSAKMPDSAAAMPPAADAKTAARANTGYHIPRLSKKNAPGRDAPRR